MLKKVIAAVTSVTMAAHACASMTLSAFADTSVVTMDSNIAMVETTTAAEAETSAEATTITTEATEAADVVTTIRDLNETPVNVRDIVYFDDGVTLTTADGETLRVGGGERIYIVDKNDADQMFRMYVPKANRVLYMSYADSFNANIFSNDGAVIGDIDCNGSVNSFDLVLMKKGLLNGWGDPFAYFMADWNGDGDVMMGDLVLLQRWLLGDI